MKKGFSLLIILFLISRVANAQFVDNGYYYFKLPESDIFGKGFSQPDGKKDPLNSGNAFQVLSSSIETVQSASSRLDAIQQNLQHNIILNTFKDSSGMDIKVYLGNVKKVRLRPEFWGQIPTNGHFYVIDALRADSIRIIGKIDKSKSGKSSFLQTVLSALTPATTAGSIILNAATKFDSTNNSLYSFYNNKVDSFDLMIKNSDVYFAARFVSTIENLGENYHNTILQCANEKEGISRGMPSLPPIHIDNQKSVSLFPYINKNGYSNTCAFNIIDLGIIVIDVTFYFDEANKTASVILKDNSPKRQAEIYRESKQVNNKMLHFENTYIYTLAGKNKKTGLFGLGKKIQQNHVIYIDYNLDFDPINKSLEIWNYKSGAFQTDVYTPKKDNAVIVFPKI